jgi:hypothetical protein
MAQNPVARKADDDELPHSNRRPDKVSSNGIRNCFSFAKKLARLRRRQSTTVNDRSEKVAIEDVDSISDAAR